jgi:hypothetical protein
MSWTDKKAIEVIKKLRDKFKIDIFIETGTFMGINAQLHSRNFIEVLTCEINEEYYAKAIERLKDNWNVTVYNEDSKSFLNRVKNEKAIFYLDAHFYDKKLPKNKRFVVIDELKTIGKNKKAVIIIHDFDNNLGHITYDGIPLDMKLIKKYLLKINPNFKFYTNTLEGCDIVKPDRVSIFNAGLRPDIETIDNLNYAWKEPRLTYRGILYCVPEKLDKSFGLREWT